MLTGLHIKNFTIIDELNINFNSGMTVFSGETGAGKSIIIDSLELILGGRGDSKLIRHGAERCEITAIFVVQKFPKAQQWLSDQELDNGDECIIRRTINLDGRSRSTINGTPCPQQLMRELGAMLVNIHGQHEHQNLLKRDQQRELLDTYADHLDLCSQVAQLYSSWKATNNELMQLQQLTADHNKQVELLNYQLSELDELALEAEELQLLHQEHKQLTNAEQLIANCNNAIDLLHADNLIQAQHQISNLVNFDTKLNDGAELINNAIIQAQEAAYELQHYLDNTNLDPERLQNVELRLNKIHDIARKHHVAPENLAALHAELKNRLLELSTAETKLRQLEINSKKLAEDYLATANKLTKRRQQTATKLAKAIMQQLARLNMANSNFKVAFTPLENGKFSAYGLEQIEFLISTNPGTPLNPLSKIVSGGELSRVSLAIQVISKQQQNLPTMIFDEVDVGIGGKTAQIVGQLLHTLGASSQLFCVTHLPQVAAQGDHQLQISKQIKHKHTSIAVQKLDQAARIDEIARMLGGVKITQQTLAHAKEMLFDSMKTKHA